MIYLDNSATTYPKPPAVYNAVNNALRQYSFNPGRGGYPQSLRTSRGVYDARTVIKDFFGVSQEEHVIFTSGCTAALNMVMKGVLRRGDHVVISSMEHNAVVRPLERLQRDGVITYSIADVMPGDDEATVENFRQAINSHTRLFVCTHASNVFGTRLPVERLCALAHSYGIPFCLDAAQSAGIIDINMERDRYDFVCCAGHKYLYGPMGIGLLLLNDNASLATLMEGGTGSESADFKMPSYYPDRLEAGTVNIIGIYGLAAGVRFVRLRGIDAIYEHENRLIQHLYARLHELSGVKIYGDDRATSRSAPVLSFGMESSDSEAAAQRLGKQGIAVRGGLHCAPLAHRSMGTLDTGTVRISPSAFTREADINFLVNSLRKFN